MAKKRKKSARKTGKKSAPARKGTKTRKSVTKRKAAPRKRAAKRKGVMATIGGAAVALIGTLGATEALRRKLGRRSPLDNE